MVLPIVLAVVISYLLGNLNGAVIASRQRGDDVRSHGSGNAGLTNFIRSYGAKNAFRVILIDAGKAVAACLISGGLLVPWMSRQSAMTIGGFFVMLGHCCPALLGFRGGKGILSGLFVALMIDWRVGCLILAVFAIVYVLSGYVSLSSVLASVAFGIGFAAFHRGEIIITVGGIAMAFLCVFMHRGNIARLLKGEEPKTNLLKKGSKR